MQIIRFHHLDESSRTLRSTVNEYQTYDEVLKQGKNLIAKLSQADWIDRLLIGFGLLVFSLVVMYILKKRIADRGISLLGYFFMPIRWFLSLLMPSLRDVPATPPSVPTPPMVTRAVEKITETVAKKVTEVAAEPTSTARGIFNLMDALVGEPDF